MDIAFLIRRERLRQRRTLTTACLSAALAAIAAAALLGISGWFITAAALAGLLGPLAASSFNYMLPSAVIRLLAIVRTLSRYGERLWGHEVAVRALGSIRPELYRAIVNANPSKSLRLTTGEATARLIEDVDALESEFIRVPDIWAAVAGATAGLTLTMLAGWEAALVTALCIGAAMVACAAMAQLNETLGRQTQQTAGYLNEAIADVATAAPELRCYGAEARAMSRIARVSDNLETVQRQQELVTAVMVAIPPAFAGVAASLSFVVSTTASAPVAALAALAAAMAVDSIAAIQRTFSQVGRVREARERLDEWLAHPTQQSALLSKPIEALAIEVGGRALVLRAGTRVALSGPSGAGKTSIVEALLGLRCAPRGLFVDSNQSDLKENSRLFAWKPQDGALLSGSVRDNLLLGNPYCDETEMWRALDEAAISNRFRNEPLGLDAWVGENGLALSGGERQRLCLTRAYVSCAPVLLLDEPTESLDGATELAVIEGLRSHLDRTGRGVLVVSHREAALALCEDIVHLPRRDLHDEVELGDSELLCTAAGFAAP